MSRLNTTPVNILALASAPTTPTPRTGDVYYNTSNSTLYAYNGTSWAAAGGGGGGGSASITISDTPPGAPTAGALWFNSTTTQTFIYYSSTWIEIGTNTNVAGAATLTRWSKTASGATSSFSGNDDFSQSLSYIAGKELVYLNGVLLYRGSDYTATDGLTITLSVPVTAGDVILVVTFGNFAIVSTVDGGNASSSQTLLKYRQDTSANWASVNPVLANGEIGYDTTTGGYKIGNGSTAWTSLPYSLGGGFSFFTYTATSGQTVVSGVDSNGLTLAYVVGKELVYINGVLQVRGQDYTATTGTSITISSALTVGANVTIVAYTSFNVSNAVPLSTVTAKGDLIVGSSSGAVTNKAVGTDGSLLMSDSTSATGLSWVGYNVAGKNAIINGGFDIWQRGTSITVSNGYTADRWQNYRGNVTVSQQTGSPSGSRYYARVQRIAGDTATNTAYFHQPIATEESTRFAGKTVTLSFYMRAGANYSSASNAIGTYLETGTGTDQNILVSWTGRVQNTWTTTLTTSWQRFSYTVTLPSNTNEIAIYWQYYPTGTAGAADYFDIADVQLELGSTATPFSRAGGTIQGELAACQRYYYRQVSDATAVRAAYGIGQANSTLIVYAQVPFKTTMRISPTSLDYSNLRVQDTITGYAVTSASLDTFGTTANTGWVYLGTGGTLTQTRMYFLDANATSSSYIGFSAEL